MTRILVVEDHPVVADGWRANLATEDGLALAGIASSLREALELLDHSTAFDVVIIDVRLGDGSGFALLDVLDLARTAAVISSAFMSSAYIETAQRLGARGFFLKGSPMRLVLAGIRDVANGGTAWDPAALAHRRARPWIPLSERERHVVGSLVDGRSNDEMARDLGITAKTVESHLTRLFLRFGVGSRGELLRLALEEGWLDVPAAPPRASGQPGSAWSAIAH